MGQFHSISHSGMALFDRPISSALGGLTIDLASAPISPGTHKLEIEATIGGIEIYLPSYVTFTVEGGPAIGGQDVHDGFPIFERIGRTITGWLGIKNKIPARAVDRPQPEEPIAIHFVIDSGVGGIDIYRL